ncbi:MAG: ribonuclease III [Candidatus Pacebacteria bacterium]|jgi:ribonuclease-3|nr:ribonuclease III [Candidatus Paceibacterota bacterium]MDP6659635.1 ribonuclease III [Candidatus Paceibacterota bacterium]
MSDYKDFEKSVGVSFKNEVLIKQAFTHRSYLNEHRELKLEHNERLEFLGDAVLELVVTDFLFRKYSDRPEGELTAFRSALVNTNSLASAAKEIGVNDYLMLSKGEAKDTGRARLYILANTFEAIIGAIYIDQGYDVAEKFISKTILHKTEEMVDKRLWQDAKSRFQEASQEKENTTPAYKPTKETGPDHDKHFIVGVYLGDKLIAEGEGKSKQEAEQEAAAKALERKGW